MRAQAHRQQFSTRSRVQTPTPRTSSNGPGTAVQQNTQTGGATATGQSTDASAYVKKEQRRQRADELYSRVKDLMLDGKESSATKKPSVPVETAPPEPKGWFQRLGEGYNNFMEGARAVDRQSDYETHIGYGVTGRSEKGSHSIQWSDGTMTHSPIHAWEKQVYGTN